VTRKEYVFLVCWLAGSSTLAMVLLVVGWPVVFCPWIWRGYTAWSLEDAE